MCDAAVVVACKRRNDRTKETKAEWQEGRTKDITSDRRWEWREMKSKKPIKALQFIQHTKYTHAHTRKRIRTSVEHGACVVRAFQCICNAATISCSYCCRRRRRCCCSYRHWPNQFSNILISSVSYSCVCVQRLPLSVSRSVCARACIYFIQCVYFYECAYTMFTFTFRFI